MCIQGRGIESPSLPIPAAKTLKLKPWNHPGITFHRQTASLGAECDWRSAAERRSSQRFLSLASRDHFQGSRLSFCLLFLERHRPLVKVRSTITPCLPRPRETASLIPISRPPSLIPVATIVDPAGAGVDVLLDLTEISPFSTRPRPRPNSRDHRRLPRLLLMSIPSPQCCPTFPCRNRREDIRAHHRLEGAVTSATVDSQYRVHWDRPSSAFSSDDAESSITGSLSI